ncbi:MAG: hypothetical protein HN929_10180 [Chloroflexi bacterium]|jgi:hypothetical protein|nr:hypothetical protein [Chloroflexota bacterium]
MATKNLNEGNAKKNPAPVVSKPEAVKVSNGKVDNSGACVDRAVASLTEAASCCHNGVKPVAQLKAALNHVAEALWELPNEAKNRKKFNALTKALLGVQGLAIVVASETGFSAGLSTDINALKATIA